MFHSRETFDVGLEFGWIGRSWLVLGLGWGQIWDKI